MNALARVLAPLALVGTILPAVLFLFHALGESAMKAIMLGAAIVWFVFAPRWMKGGAD